MNSSPSMSSQYYINKLNIHSALLNILVSLLCISAFLVTIYGSTNTSHTPWLESSTAPSNTCGSTSTYNVTCIYLGLICTLLFNTQIILYNNAKIAKEKDIKNRSWESWNRVNDLPFALLSVTSHFFRK